MSERKNNPSYELDLRQDDDAIEFVRRVERAGQQIYRDWFDDAEINLAWTSGRQDQLIDRATHTMIDDPIYDADPLLPRVFTNYMRRYVLNATSRVSESEITWRTSPRTATDDDAARSRVIDRWLQWQWDSLGMSDQQGFPYALHVMLCTGLMYACATWDDSMGEVVTIPADNVSAMLRKVMRENPQVTDEEQALRFMLDKAAPGVAPEDIGRNDAGDIVYRGGRSRVQFYTPFDVFPDPMRRRWADKWWVVTRERVAIDELRETYGNKADEVIGDCLSDLSMGSMPESDERERHEDELRVSEGVWVYRLWHKATKRYPEGLRIDVADHKVLRNVPNPYRGRIPVIEGRESAECYNSRPSPLMNDLRVLQNQHNVLQRQIVSYINKVADPKLLMEEMACSEPESYEDKSRPVYFYKKGFNPPIPFPIPPLPSTVTEYLGFVTEQLKEIANITDPSTGQDSSNAKSGRAIIALTERSDRMFTSFLGGVSGFLAEIGQHMIALWSQFEPDERTIAIVGENMRPEVLRISGRDLEMGGDLDAFAGVRKFDVRVEIGEPRSRSNVVELIDFLTERGYFNPVQDREKVLQAIESGRMPELDDSWQHRFFAGKENERFEEFHRSSMAAKAKRTGPVEQFGGGAVDPMTLLANELPVFTVAPGEDPVIHVQEHTKLTINRDFWDKVDPALQLLWVAHIEEHQAMQAAALAGAAGEPEADEAGQEAAPVEQAA